MKRTLTLAQAVEAAGILFELNSREQGVFALAERAGISCGNAEEQAALLWEWRAFVHAAVLYGLMVQAPSVVVVAYLRSTQSLLSRLGYSPEEGEAFVDGPLKAYSDPMVRTQTQECPAIFFRRLLGRELTELDPQSVAFVSGVMAMILSAVLDKLEQYAYGLE